MTLSDPDDPTHHGYELLLQAVLCRAWQDATTGRNAYERYQARAWLHSDGAAAVCDWLGLPVDTLRRRVSDNIGHKKES